MQSIIKLLQKPGAKLDIEGVAPTQYVHGKEGIDNVTGYTTATKQSMLDRGLDWVVRASGSKTVFFSFLVGLLTWALLGIPYGRTASWQVIISDVQAIVSYIFDSFLVRQLLNSYDDEMAACAQVQSRLTSHARMLRTLAQDIENGTLTHHPQLHGDKSGSSLPQETRFSRYISAVARFLGHPATIVFFWICVFVWIGIGPLCNWSDTWQLYMNSASSALMVFVFAFLANIGEERAMSTKRCLDSIFTLDSGLELKLRCLTGDTLSNNVVVISAPKVNRIQRAIFYYADLVGTLVGICLLLTVIAAWVAIGPVLHFNSNWWLLIGTYAGLIGMNDAFVLRNMQARLGSYVTRELRRIDTEDARVFEMMGLPVPEKPTLDDTSIGYRVSHFVGRVSAHEFTVIAGVLAIIGLVIGASAMRWSLTGQLLCNVPPSIIESCFMIILITGDNLTEQSKLVDLQSIYDRRVRLLSFVNGIEMPVVEPIPVALETKDGSALS